MYIAKKTKIYTAALGLLVAVALVAGGCGAVRARRLSDLRGLRGRDKVALPARLDQYWPLGEV